MEQSYIVIGGACSGEEVEIKKSRFISGAFPVSSEEEAADLIMKCRKKYYDARHHCYAYVCGDTVRCSDDGEPSGTAGKPILEVIRGSGIREVLIVVTRYFGGTLLGTGGLVRAYTEAAQVAVAAAEKITVIYGVNIRVRADYTDFGRVRYMLEQRKIKPADTEFGEAVSFSVTVMPEEEAVIMKEMNDITGGKVSVICRTEGYFRSE